MIDTNLVKLYYWLFFWESPFLFWVLILQTPFIFWKFGTWYSCYVQNLKCFIFICIYVVYYILFGHSVDLLSSRYLQKHVLFSLDATRPIWYYSKFEFLHTYTIKNIVTLNLLKSCDHFLQSYCSMCILQFEACL